MSKTKKTLIIIALFFIISFIGWCGETFAFYLVYGEFIHRGFLSIPILPIYGSSVIGIYLLFGLPFEGRVADWAKRMYRGPRKSITIILILSLYFLVSALIPTIVELGVGVYNKEVYDKRLWNYTGYPLNYKGYICIQYTVLWGVLITLAMCTIFKPMYRLVARFPKVLLWLISIIGTGSLIIDIFI